MTEPQERPRRPWWTTLTPVLFAVACAISPLTNKVDVGNEPFVILVGEGLEGQTDLFAGSSGGGEMFRVTFSRPRELAPAIDPSGTVVAFVRRGEGSDVTDLVFLDLRTNGEHTVSLPSDDGTPVRLGWNGDGARLYFRSDAGVFVVPVDAERVPIPVDVGEHEVAERALGVLLGTPVIGRVVSCDPESLAADTAGSALCVLHRDDPLALLARGAADPVRWGPDSVAYFVGDRLEVRPLGGGRSRWPAWTRLPRNPREAAYHPGPTATPDGAGSMRPLAP